MSGFFDKIANVLGFGEQDNEAPQEQSNDDYYEEDDNYEDEDTYTSRPSYSSGRSDYSRASVQRDPETYSRPSTGYHVSNVRSVQSSGQGRGSKVLNLNANVQMEVVVASPESFDEARDIAERIKNGQPVIINLEFVAHDIAQRITDFLCGTCCAMDGNIQRIANKIFMIAPENIDFVSDVDLRRSIESDDNGLGFIYGDSDIDN
jgi:cell division inhibitor SepF